MASRRGNGEGCITHEKSRNRWRGVYCDGIDKNGKTIKRSIYAKTRQEIVDRLNVINYEKAHSMYVSKSPIKLIEIIDLMIEQKYKLNIIADRQYKTLQQHKKRIEENKIANMKIQDITSTDIQNFLYELVEYSQSYIRKLISLLNNAFEDAIKKKVIYVNPMQNVIVPKSKKETKIIRALTFEEQKIFTEYLVNSSVYEENYRNVFLFQLYLGLRIGEVLALKNIDFDLKNSVVHIRRTVTEDKQGNLILKEKTKTFSGKRDIHIPQFLIPFVLEQIEISKHNKNGVLFMYRNNFVRHHCINSVLKRIFRSNLGLDDTDISSHCLRHTFATRCKESQVDVSVTQKLMGHADISETLNTYTEIQDNYRNKEFDKVNSFLESEINFKPKNE